MIPTHTKDAIRNVLTRSFQKYYKREHMNITGILIARPDEPEFKKHIHPNIEWWHHRSDCYTEFFCLGFTPEPERPNQQPVLEVDGRPWFFSTRAFSELIRDIEANTRWRYSPGCHLLLLNSRYDRESKKADLDYRHGICINIDKAVREGAVASADELAEQVFEFAKTINESPTEDPVYVFSDKAGWRLAKGSLWKRFLAFLQKPLQEFYQQAKHYAITELEPP
jgi:hypothetical protein